MSSNEGSSTRSTLGSSSASADSVADCADDIFAQFGNFESDEESNWGDKFQIGSKKALKRTREENSMKLSTLIDKDCMDPPLMEAEKRQRRKRARTEQEKQARAEERKLKNRQSAMRSRQRVLNELRKDKDEVSRLVKENEGQKLIIAQLMSQLEVAHKQIEELHLEKVNRNVDSASSNCSVEPDEEIVGMKTSTDPWKENISPLELPEDFPIDVIASGIRGENLRDESDPLLTLFSMGIDDFYYEKAFFGFMAYVLGVIISVQSEKNRSSTPSKTMRAARNALVKQMDILFQSFLLSNNDNNSNEMNKVAQSGTNVELLTRFVKILMTARRKIVKERINLSDVNYQKSERSNHTTKP